MTRSEIRLGLPARPEYGRIARVGAAHLADRRGFTLIEIDDLRLAMDEAAILLLGEGPDDGRLEVVYRVDEATVEIEMVARQGPAPELKAERVERFEELTGGLVDRCDIDPEAGTILLVKRRSD